MGAASSPALVVIVKPTDWDRPERGVARGIGGAHIGDWKVLEAGKSSHSFVAGSRRLDRTGHLLRGATAKEMEQLIASRSVAAICPP